MTQQATECASTPASGNKPKKSGAAPSKEVGLTLEGCDGDGTDLPRAKRTKKRKGKSKSSQHKHKEPAETPRKDTTFEVSKEGITVRVTLQNILETRVSVSSTAAQLQLSCLQVFAAGEVVTLLVSVDPESTRIYGGDVSLRKTVLLSSGTIHLSQCLLTAASGQRGSTISRNGAESAVSCHVRCKV